MATLNYDMSGANRDTHKVMDRISNSIATYTFLSQWNGRVLAETGTSYI